MRNRLRLSRDEEVARSPGVNALVSAIFNGSIAPNERPDIVCKKFAPLFPSDGEVIGAMIHACKFVADARGGVFTVCLNSPSRFIGQFGEKRGMLERHVTGELIKIVNTFTASLDGEHEWAQSNRMLNIDRMPMHDYSPIDGSIIDLYGECICSCEVQL